MTTATKTVGEVLDEARTFAPGIAEWIDAKRKAGHKDVDILTVLSAATFLAKHERRPD